MPHGDGTGPARGGGAGAGRGMGGGKRSRAEQGGQGSAPSSVDRVASALGTFVGSALRSRASAPVAQPPQVQPKAISSGAKKALVDESRCSGCGICTGACPAGAISMKRLPKIDTDKCTGCGECVPACPRGAISLMEILSNT